MDLSKVKDDRKLELSRWYFRGGWAFLPFLWAVNFVWFYKDAFKRPPFEEQSQIRKYVIYSGIGALIWSIALITWNIIFQKYRVEWGDLGDELTFLIPSGSP
ncbi:gamma-secretase subunit pen-2-like [Thrips palmi]|uniref:Gamma-secretase subunit PEN-2 n=1 Tax=Thrips palmi TaxID=161013 RepID=A0A6P8Y5N8_THRPL|nr:gamma-secretase subunit pen-2-like [Thrips palmi]